MKLPKLAPYVLAAASFLPFLALSQEAEEPNYRTVSVERRVVQDGNTFPVSLEVRGPETVKVGMKATYTVTCGSVPLNHATFGAAAQGVTFSPEGRGFRRLPPNGEYVSDEDAEYPFQDFAKAQPGFEQAREKYSGEMQGARDFRTDLLIGEVAPSMPPWYLDQALVQSDLALFTVKGERGFSGAKQEFVCAAEDDTTLKVFAVLKPWRTEQKTVLTADFFIDVDVEEGRRKYRPMDRPTNPPPTRFTNPEPFAISPDGRRLAYMGYDGGNLRTATINVDGSDRVIVTNRTVDKDHSWISTNYKLVRWSPDSRRIAYIEVQGNEPGLWIADVNTGESRKLDNRSINSFNWEPGREVIVSTVPEKAELYDIFSINPDTGEATNLTKTPEESETNPVWSPDGEMIAFSNGGQSAISIIGKDGSGRRKLIEDEGRDIVLSDWAGQDISFDKGSYEHWFVDIHGRKRMFYDAGTMERRFTLSSDGRYLLFTRQGQNPKPSRSSPNWSSVDLYLRTLSSGAEERLTEGLFITGLAADQDFSRIFFTHKNTETQEVFLLGLIEDK